VVTFYPGCRKPIFGVKLTKNFDNPWYQKDIPVSIFQGSIDAWVDIKLCQDIVERQKGIGTPIKYHFYENARHCFDEVYHDNISIAKKDEKCRYDEKFSDIAKKEIEELRNLLNNNILWDYVNQIPSEHVNDFIQNRVIPYINMRLQTKYD